jgi:glutaredoxin-related protein
MLTRALFGSIRRTSTLNTSALCNSFIQHCLDSYKSNKLEVDKELDKLFTSNRIVLVSDGTVDAPQSELSLNVVRMLTEIQAVPLVQINALEHPAIYGYSVHRSGSHVLPHLYITGNFYGDHDRILQKFRSGELRNLGRSSSSPVPIALF